MGDFLLIASIIIAIIYSVKIIAFSAGWFSLKKSPQTHIPEKNPFISVIVPVCNEENNILKCLKSLINQTYKEFELIIINDYSTDKTKDIIEDFIKCTGVKNVILISKSTEKKGKKTSLHLGAKYAKGDYIATTDGDCYMDKNWLKVIAWYFYSKNADMLLGPVSLSYNNSIFSKLQSLEFMSLIGVTAGAASISHPVMANAANLSFKKTDFLEFKNNETGKEYASGDDIFFMHWLKHKKKKISFIKNNDATVFCKTEKTIKNFFNQRQRWGGKTFAYEDIMSLSTAAVVFLLSLFIVVNTVSLISGVNFSEKSLMFTAGIKLIVDFPLLLGVSLFFNKTKLLLYYPLAFIIYPYYILGTVTSILFFQYKWKHN